MRQPIRLDEQELDELANTADALCEWVDEELTGAVTADSKRRVVIPPRLTVLATTLLVYGGPILFDDSSPMGICWNGGCASPY